MSAVVATSVLDDANFDLWSNMYGFVMAGLKKAIFGLSDSIQSQKIEPQLESILKDLSCLMSEVEQLRAMDWNLLH